MTYQETLKVVRTQNPGLPYKDCQHKAKALFDAYKKGQADLAARQGSAPAPGASALSSAGTIATKRPGAIPVSILADAEKEIRKGPIDVNRIMSIGHGVIPEGNIINYGKADNKVNSLVAFEDRDGNKLPGEGFFEIFIAGR